MGRVRGLGVFWAICARVSLDLTPFFLVEDSSGTTRARFLQPFAENDKMLSSTCLQGNFGRNKLPVGSVGLLHHTSVYRTICT